MAKQIYNYEVFTNKKEQLKQIQKKRVRAQWAKRIFIGIIIALIILVLYILQNSKCEYYTYKKETKTENNSDVSYETFADGYIKYSNNGIEYQKKFGTSEWNNAISFSQPILAKSENYVLLADKGGNVLMLFDVNGRIGEMTLKSPIVQAGVSDQGIIEVILEGEDSNFIQIYDKEANLIADMKSSVDETGYPVAAAISPDGTLLAISYFSIAGMTSKTTVAFYDFSGQLQTDDVTLKGGFDYEDFMIPKLSFASDDTLIAFGESATYYYDVSDDPKVEKTITFEENIESIFLGEKYVGYVLDNSDNTDEGRYRLCLYNKSGKEKLNITLDMNYDTIQMWGKEIIAVKDNECTIINIKGKILFQEELEGSTIEMIMPASGWRAYYVIFRDKTVKMNLRFWGTTDEEE